MATTERDYYELLGVPRDATEAEIKKAFRGLARELHPDVSDAPDADARFREVVEAYEVLSKSESRELYDRYGHAGLRSGGFQPGHFDFGSLSDLFSAFFGEEALGGRGSARGRRPRGDRGDRAHRGRAGRDPPGAVRGRRRVHALRRRRRRARHRGDRVPDVRRRGPAAAGVAQCLRRVRAHADVHHVLRLRPQDRDAVHDVQRRGAPARRAHARRRDSARDPRRAADPHHRTGSRGSRGNALRRRVRRRCAFDPIPASSARATTSSRPSTSR